MTILAPLLTSALDRSAIFLTGLAGRTVKIGAVREVPGSNPGGPNQKLHRSILIIESQEYSCVRLRIYSRVRVTKFTFSAAISRSMINVRMVARKLC